MRERSIRSILSFVAVALTVSVLGSPGFAQQTAGLQPISLSFGETSSLDTTVVGQGIDEITTPSTGTTTAGGILSWEKYRERNDDLGMLHVYYHQRYYHPGLNRQIGALGTAVALHYAPDGSLRWVHGAQLANVATLPSAVITTAEAAFATVQDALATWPGFSPGNPMAWSGDLLAALLDDAELSLATLPNGAGHRLQWRVRTLDATLRAWEVVLDASTSAIVTVTPGEPGDDCYFYPDPCPDCNAVDPDSVAAKAVPENTDLLRKDCGSQQNEYCYCGVQTYSCGSDGLRNVKANPCSTCAYYQYQDDDPVSCGGVNCTHEAVWSGGDGVPLIEIYFGMFQDDDHLHCGQPNEGEFMRLGVKAVSGYPSYSNYSGRVEIGPHYGSTNHRKWAGDAMLFTHQTMEVFHGTFGWCGVEGNCSEPGVARVTVDAHGGSGGAFFNPGGGVHTPNDAIGIDTPSGGRSQSAALDIIAHEWGHGVDSHGSANFAHMCAHDFGDTCQLSEGFSDAIGHTVEQLVQTVSDPDPGDDTFFPEQREWFAGEDWNPTADARRRADKYDTRDIQGGWHYSVHADDEPCEPYDVHEAHNGGNRLSVALRLMAVGGAHPDCDRFDNCDIEVNAIELEQAAMILFRVLTVQADESTTSWSDLPQLSLWAAYDLYFDVDPNDICAMQTQISVRTAFAAVGYTEAEYVHDPGIMCNGCPPWCEE